MQISKKNTVVHVRCIAKWLEFVVIPLYHPAAALYNGGMRQTLIDDFIQAVDFVKNNSGA